MSQSIIPSLLQAHYIKTDEEIIPIEDVYITGILANAVGLQCQSNGYFPFWSQGPSHENLNKLKDGQLFGVHNVKYESMYVIHKMVNQQLKS